MEHDDFIDNYVRSGGFRADGERMWKKSCLQSAAPVLLAALRNLMTAYSRALNIGQPNQDPAWLDADAAVAKAEGRQPAPDAAGE